MVNLSTNHLRGLASTRYAKSLLISGGARTLARAHAASAGWRDTPIVERALAEALDTDSGSPLLAEIGFDFSEFLRPLTIIGRITGFRRVPFRVRMLAQTGGVVAYWVGQRLEKPVTKADFTNGETLEPAKVAAIIVETEELSRFSGPAADSILSADLGRGAAQAMDAAFIDPLNTGEPDVKPAAVTSVASGAVHAPSTGNSLAEIDADLSERIDALSDAGSDLSAAVWVMRPRTAVYLSRLRGSGGALAYPTVTARGGTLFGLPIVTSANVPVENVTGAPSSITLLDPSQIALADDGEAELDVARHASIQMDDEPQEGHQAQVSLWQVGCVALKAERTVNWRARRSGMVQVLTGVTY